VASIGALGAGAQGDARATLEEELFNALDGNADGHIDRSEFAAAMRPASDTGARLDLEGLQKADAIFGQNDLNHDGFLDSREAMINLASDDDTRLRRKVIRKLAEGFQAAAEHGYRMGPSLVLVAHILASAEEGMTPDEAVELIDGLVKPRGSLEPPTADAMPWVREMIGVADLDKSGELSKDELALAWDIVADAVSERATRVSEMLNKLGQEDAELQEILRSLSKAGADGNGQIQRREWPHVFDRAAELDEGPQYNEVEAARIAADFEQEAANQAMLIASMFAQSFGL